MARAVVLQCQIIAHNAKYRKIIKNETPLELIDIVLTLQECFNNIDTFYCCIHVEKMFTQA